MAVCGSCDARDPAREYAAGNSLGPGWHESARDLRLSGGWVGRRPLCRQAGSGMRDSQPGQGAAELLSPRPAIRKMQGQPACRAGEPSGREKNRCPPEGLGAVANHALPDRSAPSSGPGCGPGRLDGQPGAVGGRSGPRPRWFSPTPYLRPRYVRILHHLGVAAMVSLQFEQLPRRPGRSDEAMIAVDLAKRASCGTGTSASPAGR